MGRYFELTGIVTKGDGIGRTIDFPTANINVKESYKLIPLNGVYLVSVKCEDNLFKGMMNIGIRPTINGKRQTLEVHIFNFNKDIYNQKLKILFIEKIRDEQKFESLDALKKQLEKDKEISKRSLIKKGLH